MDTVDVIVFNVREASDGSYVAESEGASIVSVARGFDELKSMVRDAVQCHFEPGEEPRSIQLVIVLEQVTVT